ncbi:DgyrCDS10108 [Dimorphilus gyrociliatus]|uniref:DgyrCDS10108 n=1 Tax=Dimorphilus gyrociliatus TaxID=2664684 RepID=A0A7I8W1S6_9ANNE|nr:DgyrCDS10108 [Dimorphilus gyrociliatus]
MAAKTSKSKTFTTNVDLHADVDHDFFDDEPTTSAPSHMTVTVSKKEQRNDSGEDDRPYSRRERRYSSSSHSSYSSDYTNSDSDTSKEREELKSRTPGRPPSGRRNSDSHSSRRKKDCSSPDLTDVSPAPSPKPQKKPRPKSAVTFKEPTETDTDSTDMRILTQAIFEMDRKNSGGKKFVVPDKNYSFNNIRLDEINSENERLLRKLMEQNKRPKSATKAQSKKQKAVMRMTPSAVNRKKEQERIEQENWALLKRLERAKATRGLQRDALMKNYHSKTLCGVPIAAAHTSVRRPQLRAGSESTEYLYLREDHPVAESNVEVQRYKNSARSRPSSAKTTSRPSSAKPRPGSAKSRPPWQEGW